MPGVVPGHGNPGGYFTEALDMTVALDSDVSLADERDEVDRGEGGSQHQVLGQGVYLDQFRVIRLKTSPCPTKLTVLCNVY